VIRTFVAICLVLCLIPRGGAIRFVWHVVNEVYETALISGSRSALEHRGATIQRGIEADVVRANALEYLPVSRSRQI